jgi:hypothetical protein
MICPKCGTQNAAGDAFCGGCGAFLEFAAEEAVAPDVAAFDNEIAIPLKLVDVEGSQRVDIPSQLGVVGVTRLRITIVDWYPATKTAAAGSPTTQAAISEIRLFGIPVTP